MICVFIPVRKKVEKKKELDSQESPLLLSVVSEARLNVDLNFFNKTHTVSQFKTELSNMFIMGEKENIL